MQSLPLMRKTFIEAKVQRPLGRFCYQVSSAYAEDFHWGANGSGVLKIGKSSLPLMRKTFIEARNSRVRGFNRRLSLPLMRKTFIEACVVMRWRLIMSWRSLFRLCGRLSLRLRVRASYCMQSHCLFRLCGRLSLRHRRWDYLPRPLPWSLPLMRKTFIEASSGVKHNAIDSSLFRLCGRLSLRLEWGLPRRHNGRRVSSAYAEDFHWGGRSNGNPVANYAAVSSAYAEDFHWGGEYPRVYGKFCCFLHCYGGFHWGQGKCEFIPSFGFPLLI